MKEYKCLECGQVNGDHNMIRQEGNHRTGYVIQCPDCMSHCVEDWAMVPETNKHYIIFERPKGSTVFTMASREGLQTIYHKHETAKRDVDTLLLENTTTEFAIYVCRIATVHQYSVCEVS